MNPSSSTNPPTMISNAVTSDTIFQEVIDNEFSLLASQFDEIKATKWSEEEFIVLEAAMAIAAGTCVEFREDTKSALKYLCFSIEACKRSTKIPGEELTALLSCLGLTLKSSERDMKKALEKARNHYAESKN